MKNLSLIILLFLIASCGKVLKTHVKGKVLNPVTGQGIENVRVILQKSGSEKVDISIFPNPSKAEVTVLFPVNLEGTFEIVNSIGAIIQKNTVPSDYKSILKLESGIYFLHFQSNLGHKLTKQIIIL